MRPASMATLQKLIANFKNSMRGLKVGLTEHSFLLEVMAGGILVPLLFLNRALSLKLLVILAYLLLLSCELLNTAIEKICDRITREHDLAIKDIKDMASAAVFLVVIANILILAYYLFAF
jgi:diacylglycerol kinase (ATP)